MKLIDSHCHFDTAAFEHDREQALARARDRGVYAQIVPAIKQAWWPGIKAVCAAHSDLHPAYGLHPMFMQEHAEAHLLELEQWLNDEHPVAVGECGLDFFIEAPNKAGQQRIFEEQLALARQHKLPVIIHARRAVEEVLNTLRRYPGLRGVLHSFSGSLQQARRLIDMGFFLGFGGPVTYPRAKRLRRLVCELPIEGIMLETDAPDQPDIHHRGQRNEPARLEIVLETISQLRGEPPEAIAEATTRNAKTLFSIY